MEPLTLPKEFTQPLYPVLGIYGLSRATNTTTASAAASTSAPSSTNTTTATTTTTAFLGQTRYPDIHASLYDIWMTRSERDKPMFRLVNLNTQPLVQQSGLLVPPRKYFTRAKDWVPTTNWIVRHTKVIPAIVVCFYDLPDGDNMQEQRDMVIMNDINEKRKQLVTRNIRLVIIFLTDSYQLNKVGIDERLARFKLVCSLESKNSMYVLPSSGLDLVEFISG